MTTQLYVLAQIPPSDNATICPVQATSVAKAIQQAERNLGVRLQRLGGGTYSDGTREFFIYFGEKGIEQFGESFGGYLENLGRLPDAPPTMEEPRFELGTVVATPAALEALRQAGEQASIYLQRHGGCDWGVVCASDSRANDRALKDGSRIVSAYLLKNGTKVWIVTEAESDDGRRASTCVMMPDDY